MPDKGIPPAPWSGVRSPPMFLASFAAGNLIHSDSQVKQNQNQKQNQKPKKWKKRSPVQHGAHLKFT